MQQVLKWSYWIQSMLVLTFFYKMVALVRTSR